jgi:hypothetical protein
MTLVLLPTRLLITDARIAEAEATAVAEQAGAEA